MSRPPINILAFGFHLHDKHPLADAIAHVWKKKKLPVEKGKRTLEDKAGTGTDPKFEVGELRYASPTRSYVQIDCVGRDEAVITRAFKAGIPIAGAVLVAKVKLGSDMTVEPTVREHMIAATNAGLRHLVIFLDGCASYDGMDMNLELESEAREVPAKYGYDVDGTPVIFGDLAGALAGDAVWEASIEKLIAAIDSHIPG